MTLLPLKRNILALYQSIKYAYQHFKWLYDPQFTPHEQESLHRHIEQM